MGRNPVRTAQATRAEDSAGCPRTCGVFEHPRAVSLVRRSAPALRLHPAASPASVGDGGPAVPLLAELHAGFQHAGIQDSGLL